ncbi:YggN family protein [Pseudoalteromonas spongiae]|uniref:YggN family protein n=1 Tax=Pseudoalteromonas spongiae TaxID=298657 RepID=UPI00110C111B|nr:YggN family protein [Pseudoalteromonas spongiae]TMO85901.1 hypothetical protein CWC15_07050 [Pseudoalteromonas spongiae]
MKLVRFWVFLITSILFSNASLADELCDVELGHGLIITDDVIRIVDKGQTNVQINNDTQLFIRGRWVELNDEEMQVLKEYSKGLRSTVPELVKLATDGVNLGLSAIEQVVTGFTDKEPEVLKDQLKYVEIALKDKFKAGDDFFYIAPQSLSKLDDFFEKEISQKIHSAVHGSLGAILVALGDAFESNEGNIEQKITGMGERIDIIASEIDKSLQKKVVQLEQKANQYCGCLRTLNETEDKLQQLVPELADFDLVQVKGLSL